eukprot:951768-Amorphochlora_amoeboformis.AAC.1
MISHPEAVSKEEKKNDLDSDNVRRELACIFGVVGVLGGYAEAMREGARIAVSVDGEWLHGTVIKALARSQNKMVGTWKWEAGGTKPDSKGDSFKFDLLENGTIWKDSKEFGKYVWIRISTCGSEKMLGWAGEG